MNSDSVIQAEESRIVFGGFNVSTLSRSPNAAAAGGTNVKSHQSDKHDEAVDKGSLPPSQEGPSQGSVPSKTRTSSDQSLLVGHSKATQLRRACSCFFSLYMVYLFLGSDYTVIFQYHPIAFAIAFIGIMPEVVALTKMLRRQRSAFDRETYLNRHLYSSIAVKFLSFIGFIAITINKEKQGKRHYTTWHGLLGLLTMIVLSLQVIIGLIFHFRCLSYESLSLLRKSHKYLGIALLTIGSITMWLGIQTNYFQRNVTDSVFGTFLFGTLTATLSYVAYRYE